MTFNIDSSHTSPSLLEQYQQLLRQQQLQRQQQDEQKRQQLAQQQYYLQQQQQQQQERPRVEAQPLQAAHSPVRPNQESQMYDEYQQRRVNPEQPHRQQGPIIC